MAAARIQISAVKDAALYAGQPITATLSVHSSFHWGTSANDKERKYVMQYDVEEMVKEWLVSGKKRGTFIATVRVFLLDSRLNTMAKSFVTGRRYI